MINFLNIFTAWLVSSDSSGVLTLVTGLIAWFVYRHQVKLREREAAVILLNEIRNAEKNIDDIKNGTDISSELVSILPIYSWEKSYQIFTRHLNRDNFDFLNSFFHNCKAAQQELIRLRSFLTGIAMKKKAELVQEKLLDLAEKYKDQNFIKDGKIDTASEYVKEKESVFKIFYQENDWFLPNRPKEDFLKYVSNIKQITGTVVAEKLRQIAKEK